MKEAAKRKDHLAYKGGRSRPWLTIKNPNSLAARRVENASFWMWMPTRPFILAQWLDGEAIYNQLVAVEGLQNLVAGGTAIFAFTALD
jgi:hypothetical protein